MYILTVSVHCRLSEEEERAWQSRRTWSQCWTLRRKWRRSCSQCPRWSMVSVSTITRLVAWRHPIQLEKPELKTHNRVNMHLTYTLHYIWGFSNLDSRKTYNNYEKLNKVTYKEATPVDLGEGPSLRKSCFTELTLACKTLKHALPCFLRHSKVEKSVTV